jgi:hypothetical protein
MPDQMETIPYEGKDRRVIGRLRYLEPPEPGTLVGPNAWGEKCVILATVNGVTLVGLAVAGDIDRATVRIQGLDGQTPSGPRSLQERRVNRVAFNA